MNICYQLLENAITLGKYFAAYLAWFLGICVFPNM